MHCDLIGIFQLIEKYNPLFLRPFCNELKSSNHIAMHFDLLNLLNMSDKLRKFMNILNMDQSRNKIYQFTNTYSHSSFK